MARANKKRELSAKQPAQEPQPTPPIQVQEPQEEPSIIRKGIYLSALIYIEGDQSAPDDFAALATSALKQALIDALKGEHDGLTISLKKVEPRNDIEEDDPAEVEDTDKFQF